MSPYESLRATPRKPTICEQIEELLGMKPKDGGVATTWGHAIRAQLRGANKSLIDMAKKSK